MQVSSDTNQVDGTFTAVENIIFVTSSNVCHNTKFQIGVVVTDDGTNIVVITEFPFSEFVYVEKLFRSFVAKFHIVNTSS